MSDETEATTEPLVDRRTAIRLLVGVGIGVPVAVEGLTFAGLVRNALFGDGDRGAGGAGTDTPATVDDGIEVGDDLLPATPQHDRLSTATLRAGDDARTLTLAAVVTNDSAPGYEFRLGAVTTDGGETVDGGGATGRLNRGDTGTVAAQYDLPAAATPASVAVAAVVDEGEGEGTRTFEGDARLAPIPVEGA